MKRVVFMNTTVAASMRFARGAQVTAWLLGFERAHAPLYHLLTGVCLLVTANLRQAWVEE